MNAHEVKPVRLIQLLCAVCGSNLAGLTLLYVLPCVAAVVSRPAWRMLVLLIARYDSNLINEHYYLLHMKPTYKDVTKLNKASTVDSLAVAGLVKPPTQRHENTYTEQKH